VTGNSAYSVTAYSWQLDERYLGTVCKSSELWDELGAVLSSLNIFVIRRCRNAMFF